MATVPLSGTNIRLISGVPFSNDYKNTRWFDTVSQQTSYFLGKNIVHSMNEANFQRIEGKQFIAVNKSIDDLWNTNYLMFQNAHYNSKWFYAFVTKLEFKQKNTTYVHFEIDVFQTWKFDMDFKPSFVVREHRPLWNSDGTPVINTVDEGLDYGKDYDVMEVTKHRPYEDLFFMVIVSKSPLHDDTENEIKAKEVKASMNGLPQPLSYYVHPFKSNGESPQISGGFISPVLHTLQAMAKMDNTVNNIVSIYVTDFVGLDLVYDGTTLTLPSGTFTSASIADGETGFNTYYVKSIPDYNEHTKNLGNKYSGYRNVKESKLLMHPYTALILDDFKGNRSVIKNEYINGTDLKIMTRGSLGTGNKVAYSILEYLTTSGIDYGGELISSLEKSVINNNPNDLPVINDYLSAYLQGNRNSLENQKNQAIFNGVVGGLGGALGAVANAPNPVGIAGGIASGVSGVGNAVFTIQGIEAKKQDIDNLPPQLTKMGSNTYFDYGNGINGVYLLKKQIKPEYIKKLEDFFNMFGYKTNEVKVPNFHTRRYWNYVQTLNCNIIGNFNNEDLQELKSVFDNGITLWHTDDIGNYSLANEVI